LGCVLPPGRAPPLGHRFEGGFVLCDAVPAVVRVKWELFLFALGVRCRRALTSPGLSSLLTFHLLRVTEQRGRGGLLGIF